VRILIVHLSDIHIKAENDAVLKRARRVADAANSRRDGADLTLVVVGGDIAFSGTAKQYELARAFLEAVAENLDQKPLIAVAPGNHDCDFSADMTVRDLLIDALRENPAIPVGSPVIDQCVSVQQHFFKFRDSLEQAKVVVHNPLYYEYVIPIDKGDLIVRCYNTAWMCSLKGRPGTLTFPEAALDVMTNGRFAISLFHHPYNWLTSARPFRRIVERRSDLVLTGHEHQHDRALTYRPDTLKATTYVEGGALQDCDDPNSSALNVILVDVERAEQQFHHFELRGDHYYPKSEEDVWEPLPLHAYRSDELFGVQPKFQEWLDDLGINNANKTGRQRTLEEVFLYPELIEQFRDPTLSKRRLVVKSEDVSKELLHYDQVFIASPQKSGRTSLAKQLFLDYLDLGLVPVYLNGLEDHLRLQDGSPKSLFRQVGRQYGDASLETFRQLKRHRKVILVDNLDRARGNNDSLRALIQALSAQAGHIVVFGDDMGGRITELAPMVEGPDVKSKVFRIRPFNHGLRERLAQRWFDGDDDADDLIRSQNLERAARTLDTILGRNYVPAFPIFITAVLQGLEAGSGIDMNASTHGYFYEILIKLALASRNPSDYNIRLNFLTHLAYEMFSTGKQELLESELRVSFDRYQEKYAVGGLVYESLKETLSSKGMLISDSDRIRFRYHYLYYYFVANHLRNNIASDETRAHVQQLTQTVGEQDSSDILMFLVHLSNENFIIERILATADSFYSGTAVATLDSSSKLDQGEVQLAYTEKKSVEEARREWADEKDRQIEKRELAESAQSKVSDEAKAAGISYRSAVQTIQIVGQVLRNFPGSLDVEKKVKLTRACTSLGLRCLTLALEYVEAERSDMLDAIMAELRNAYPNLGEDKVTAKARLYLWFGSVLASFAVLKTISNAIAAPTLEPIYDKAFALPRSSAVKLVDASIRMYLSNGFPEGLIDRLVKEFKDKNRPLTLLKLFSLEHFEQIAVPNRQRQSICAKLKIEYRVAALGPSK
jgi:predicted MPP superfamily phosphohydrolase